MLQIYVPEREYYDPKTNKFFTVKGKALQLEHSLVSMSKWEAKWKKYYLTNKAGMSGEEFLDYIRCMTLTQNVDPMVYRNLTKENLTAILDYIKDPMTATTFSEEKNKPKNNKNISTEEIYYWMIALNIPMECQKWHFNRLYTLIKICSIRNSTAKKKTKSERINSLKSRAELNAQRRKMLNSSG